jgi:hypothetical protein
MPGLTGRLSSLYTLSAPHNAVRCKSSPPSSTPGTVRYRSTLPPKRTIKTASPGEADAAARLAGAKDETVFAYRS